MISILDDALIYAALSLLLAGPALYILDRIFGVAFYRWQYDIRHKDPLSEDKIKGLVIYERSAHLRFWFAFFLSFCHFVYYMVHGSGFALQLLMDAVAFLGIFFGFNIGPAAYKLWGRKDTYIQTLDDVGGGKVKVTEKASEAIKGIVNAAGQAAVIGLQDLHTMAATPQKVEPAIAQLAPAPVEKTAVEPPKEPLASAEDPRATIDRFIKGGHVDGRSSS